MSEKNQTTKTYDYEKNPLGDYNPKGTTFGEQIGMKVITNENVVPIDHADKMFDMIAGGENSLPVIMKHIEEMKTPERIKIFFALQVGLQFDKIHMKKLVEEVMENKQEEQDFMTKLAKDVQKE
jgi:hypothetical protein